MFSSKSKRLKPSSFSFPNNKKDTGPISTGLVLMPNAKASLYSFIILDDESVKF